MITIITPYPWATDSFNGMPYRKIGNTGLKSSVVGLGTWKFGYPETGDDSRVDEKTAFEIFDKAIELGVTFWDTANRYNNSSGNSERIIGKWFAANPGQRRNVVLATKVFGGMDGFTPNHSGLSRSNILDSVYSCLERLKTEYIDILYFHSFDEQTPIIESLCAIDDLIKMDVIRYFAVSNFSVAQLESYQKVITENSMKFSIAAVQNQYDIIRKEDEKYKGVLKYAHDSQISFIGWSPLAGGLLTERYDKGRSIGPGDRLYDENQTTLLTDSEIVRKREKLSEVAQKTGLGISQLALAYMLTLPGMGPVIPSSSSVKQLVDNAKAGTVILEDDYIKEIDDRV